MKARINEQGYMQIWPESSLEVFALAQWVKINVNPNIDRNPEKMIIYTRRVKPDDLVKLCPGDESGNRKWE